MARTPRLGRGLSSLMTTPVAVEPPAPEPVSAESAAKPTPMEMAKASARPKKEDVPDGEGIEYLEVGRIRPNPHQPRKQFNEGSINRLAASIKTDGLMQPIIVRPGAGGGYELVAGERRWRAAQKAGLARMPAIVRELNDRQLAEWALIENLQREDLNPIERAQAFQHLLDRFSLSHDEIAKRVGVERPTISNSLRLLVLCDDVRILVQEGLISAGHARAIVGIADPAQQVVIARRIVRDALSVRQVEALVRKSAGEAGGDPELSAKSTRAAHHSDLERQIARHLGAKVHIRPGRKKGTGTMSIRFDSLDQFDRLMEQLGVQAE